MKAKLRKLLDRTLCDMVNNNTNLRVKFNNKTGTVKINGKGPYKLTEEDRNDLIKLLGV